MKDNEQQLVIELDKDLIRRAWSAAALEGKTKKQWLAEAIEARLEAKEEAKDRPAHSAGHLSF